MAERIASGEIHVSVNDEQALRDLRRIDDSFDRTMRKIDGERATVEIAGDLHELDDAVAQAKRKVRQLEGERAEVELGIRKGDLEKLDAAIREAKHNVRSVDGMRAEVEFDVKGEEKVLAARARMEKLADAEAKALRRAQVEQERRRKIAAFGIDQEVSKVIELQRQYSKLTEQMERLNKRRPIGREARAKVDLDAAGLSAKMLAIKRQLNFLGGHPPAHIQVDIDRDSFKKKAVGFVSDIGAFIGKKMAGLSDASVRLGPFTTSIRGLGIALSILGPTLADVAGAAGALVGVLGAGIAGAGALGAGALTGMASAGLGLMFATRNTRQELQQARTSISAYDNAVLKFGKNSDKAKAKQKEMNSVLRQISPLAREAALGTEDFFRKWDKGTQDTQKNLGIFAKRGFGALDAIRPIMQRQANVISRDLATAMGGVRDFFKHGEGSDLLSGITADFDKQVPTILHGLGSIAHAFLLIGREGARNLHFLTGGFDDLGTRLLRFTQRDDFGDTVKRWVSYARDIMRFFGAAGRVLVHFFGAGSSAGDSFLKTMTNALNRWDDFIQSTEGHNRIADFFKNSVQGTETLYNALKPIVELFALWAVGLEPAVRAITMIFGGLTKVTSAVGKLVGLQNPLATLGATLGAMWAVSKIGGFVSMLARAVTLMKELGAIGTLKSIFSGQFLGRLKMGAGIETAGAAAAAEMRAAIVSGGTMAAAEMRAAMAAGGATSGLENAAGGLLGPRGKAITAAEREAMSGAEVAAGGAAASKAARGFGLLRTAVTGVGAAFGIEGLAASSLATGGLALVGAAAVYGGYKLLTMKSASDKLHDSIHGADIAALNYSKSAHAAGVVTGQSGMAMHDYHDSIRNVNILKKELNQLEAHGGKNTDAYRAKLQELNQALTDRASRQRDVKKLANEQNKLDAQTQEQYGKRLKAEDNLADAEKRRAEVAKQVKEGVATQRDLAAADSDVAAAKRSLAMAHRQEAQAAREAQLGELNYQRGLRGLIPLAGKAATALLNLRRRAPNLTQKIAVKFQDPKDAGQVAQRASAALKSGVSSKLVTKIVADSKSAEEAIRRINAAQIKAKVLRISHKGGDVTLGMLQRISGHKLTAKQQRILEKGGDAALGTLRRILGFRLNDKQFKAWLRTNAPGLLAAINAGINSLHDKSVTITTTHITKTMAIHRSGNDGHAASGHRPGRSATKLIGEGSGPEIVADTRSGSMFKTSGPMFYNLRNSEAVIPTEPKYRDRGREIFAQVAKQLGIEGFRKGRKAKIHHLSAHGKAGARADARKSLPKKHNYQSENNEELPKVEKAKQKEEDQVRWISILEGRMKEPASFIKQVGTDPATGDPIYDVDQDAVNNWVAQLNAMAAQYDILIDRINDVSHAIQRAQSRVKSVISNATRNINRVQRQINHEQAKLNSNKTSVATKEGAKERIRVYKGYLSDEKQARANAQADEKMLADDLHDVPFRRIEAGDKANEYRADAAATIGKAEADVTQANPKPERPGAGGGAGEGISYERQTALADVEMAAVRQQYAPNTFQVEGGGPASAAMPGLQVNPALMPNARGGAGTTPDKGGKSVAAVIGGSAAATSIAGGAAAARSVSAPGGAASAVGTGAVADNSKTVNFNQTNNFAAPPPDPHIHVKGMQFEAGALV